MPPVPILYAREVIRALERAGYTKTRQSGSHQVLTCPGRGIVVVPIHTGDLPRGTLRSILGQAGLTVEELEALL